MGPCHCDPLGYAIRPARRPGISADSGRGSGFRHSIISALRARRRYVPLAPVVHPAIRSGSRHRRRHETLRHTGWNAEVFEAPLLLVAGSWGPGPRIRWRRCPGSGDEPGQSETPRMDRPPQRTIRRALHPPHPQLHVICAPDLSVFIRVHLWPLHSSEPVRMPISRSTETPARTSLPQ